MKNFVRIKEDSLIAGVCTGIGEYFKLPKWFIRILFILFISEISILIYILIWVFSREK